VRAPGPAFESLPRREQGFESAWECSILNGLTGHYLLSGQVVPNVCPISVSE
jgi:hypothetical protein